MDLVGLLTIFVLAIFVGFEVITKVPPTLHTPLMSGSNAISGITIIGALLAAGSVSDPHLGTRLRYGRAGLRHDQRRRRIPGDRPHAQDVPEALGHAPCSHSNIVNIAYLVAAVLFILDLKWMAHPAHRRARQPRRRPRHADRRRRDAAQRPVPRRRREHRLDLHPRRAGRRRRHRRGRGAPRQDDRHARDGRAVQRLRRRGLRPRRRRGHRRGDAAASARAPRWTPSWPSPSWPRPSSAP